jgi:flavin reductase (DIM6/NTAB) family NADH-FMN oxidoreductase RutF
MIPDHEGDAAAAGSGSSAPGDWVELDAGQPIWERFFTVNPLVLVGTREGDGHDMAPKHMAFPLGWENYFGFVCTPRHATYHNARQAGGFGVSYPRPDQLLLTSLAAQPREEGEPTPGLELLPTEPGRRVDAPLLRGAYVQLECELDRVIDGFGANSLVVGRVVQARVRREALRTTDRSDTELVHRTPLLAYLHPGRIAGIQDSRVYPFPADFHK